MLSTFLMADIRVAFVVALALMGMPARAGEPVTCQPDTVLVFDASGSMAATDFPGGAPSRMDRARQSLTKVLTQIPPTRHVGLVTYGPPSASQDICMSATLKVAPQRDFASPILTEVDQLQPDGRTPLTHGVKLAIDVLKGSTGTVVLLTDGQETCKGDPCALAANIKRNRPGIVVHVIGYKLDQNLSASGAECLAQSTNGLSLRADTSAELVAALNQAFGCQAVAVKRNNKIKRL